MCEISESIPEEVKKLLTWVAMNNKDYHVYLGEGL